MTVLDKSQLPEGAQISQGGTKEPVGVLVDNVSKDDLLMMQARSMARARGGNDSQIWRSGGDVNDDVLSRVSAARMPGMAGMNQQTLSAIQEGTFNRDQAFVGNNANFTGYWLEPGAKYIFPLDTPVRNILPRVASVGVDTINWRAITDLFGGAGPAVSNFILQQYGTPAGVTYNWVNQSNVFKMIAIKDLVTLESELYGRLFEGDVRAKIASKLIPALMLGQEVWYLNAAQKLWAPSPALVSTATTGGTVAAGTNWFLITAVNGNGETLAYSTTGVSQVTTGSTSTVTLTIFRVPGATKYNVYCGIGSTQPANSAMWLQSATTQFGGATALNDVAGVAQGYITATMTAAPATSGTAYSTVVTAGNTAIAFKSTETNTLNQPLTFDGIQSLAYLAAGAGSTVGAGSETSLVRQPAATNGALALSDIDTLLENMYLNSHANPEALWIGVKDHKKVSNLVAQGTNFRITTPNTGSGMNDLVAGQRVTKYLNQTTGRLMDVFMVPYLTQGTIMAVSTSLPFQVAEIEGPPLRIEYNRDMWAQEYPPDQSHMTQYQYSAYSNETMVNQFLGGTGILTGITLS